MNRHEDELEKEIADKYIENMDAPDLWGKIEAGLDAVDAQRVQDKKSGDKKFGVKKDRKDRNRRTIRSCGSGSGVCADRSRTVKEQP